MRLRLGVWSANTNLITSAPIVAARKLVVPPPEAGTIPLVVAVNSDDEAT